MVACRRSGHATSGTFPAGGPASDRAAAAAAGGGGGLGGGGGGAARWRPAAARAADGGGMFGGDTRALAAAVEYAEANGGGTIAVSSQSGAAGSLITSGADVAAIGGFSGRESQVRRLAVDHLERGRRARCPRSVR